MSYNIYSNINFDYDPNSEFNVFIEYKQVNGKTYKFFANYNLNDLDTTRRMLITGKYLKDLEVFYKQMMSDIYHDYGKLRKGFEYVTVNHHVIYNNLSGWNNSSNFRYEKMLDSYNDEDYIDEDYDSGTYYVNN